MITQLQSLLKNKEGKHSKTVSSFIEVE